MSYKKNMQESFDETLELRRLKYEIHKAENELAKAEYSRTKTHIDLQILKGVSGQFAGYIQGKEAAAKQVSSVNTKDYKEITITYDKPLGVVPTLNGMMQDLSGDDIDIRSVLPAPSNEGNSVALFCNVKDESQIDKLKELVAVFPYEFSLLVYSDKETVSDKACELEATNLKDILIRIGNESCDNGSENSLILFADRIAACDELISVDLGKVGNVSNDDLRKIAALFHNILDLAYLESDMTWVSIDRLKQNECSIDDVISGDCSEIALFVGLASAVVGDDSHVHISRNVVSVDAENEDKTMNDKNYDIPEDMESMRNELIKCMDRIAELEAEQNDLKESAQKKKDEADVRSRNIIDKMEKQMSILKMENVELRVANAAIKDSISWRITKPVRDFGALFIK